jgi:hypothetical protein
MTSCAHRVTTQQFVHAAAAVCAPQDELDVFSDGTVKTVIRLS